MSLGFPPHDDPFIEAMYRRGELPKQRLEPYQRAERGRQVTELLQNPLVAEAFRALQAEIFEEWANVPSSDVISAESLRSTRRGLTLLLGKLRAWRDDGDIAEREMRKLKGEG